MKRLLTAIVMLAVAAAAQISCEKYEDGKPSKNGRSEFERMYPDAKDVEWETDFGYWKVSFEIGTPPNETDYEAWFDITGNWVRTEKEILFSALPQVITDALEASEYASAVLSASDVEYVETPDGNYYQLEILVKGVEVKLKVDEAGKISLAGVGF